MAAQNRTDLLASFAQSGSGNFPDNTTRYISPARLRLFVEAIIESAPNILDDTYLSYMATAPAGADTYTATVVPAISAYTAGQMFVIKFTTANTGASTLNINTLGAKSIVKNGSSSLESGDISAGQIFILLYDGTNFQVIGGSGGGGDFWPLDGTSELLGNVTLVGNGFNITLGQSGDRAGNFRVWSNGTARIDATTAAGLQSDGDVDMESTGHGQLLLGAGGHIITDNNAVKKGLQTAASGYVTDPRSYTDKEYVDSLMAANDAMQFKGVIDASTNPNYPAADAGHTYKISVAGKVGGASGKPVEVGDIIICTVDGSASGNEATVGANWTAIQVNLDGAVIGPASSTSDNIPTFDGISGKLLKDSGKAHSIDGTFASNSDNKIPTEKATKTYSDTKLALAGGTMSGNIAMGNNKLTGLSAGSAAGDSVRYEQVIGTQDLYIPAGAWTPRTSNGCAQISTYENATSKANVDVLYFDSTSQEFAQFKIVMPRNWDNGTITAKFHWMAPSGTGTVVWGISAVALSDGDAFSTSFGTRQSISDAIGTTETMRSTAYTSAITIAGTPADADLIILQIDRDPADGSDNFNADAGLIGVTITITTDAAVAS